VVGPTAEGGMSWGRWRRGDAVVKSVVGCEVGMGFVVEQRIVGFP
jgi:hypothetical protein